MATEYSAAQIQEIYKEAQGLYDDMCRLYDEVIYDGGSMYQIRQNLKGVSANLRVFEKLNNAAKAHRDEYDEFMPMLTHIRKTHIRIKNYHKKNIKKDLLRVEEETARAVVTCAEIKTLWLPKLKSAVAKKQWTEASELVLDTPYQIKQHCSDISTGVIRDKRVIKTIRSLDDELKTHLDKIPLKTYDGVVIARQQVKMEKQRESVLNWLDMFRAKVEDKNAFKADDFSSYSFAAKDIAKLKEDLDKADDIEHATNEYKDLAKSYYQRSQSREND